MQKYSSNVVDKLVAECSSEQIEAVMKVIDQGKD